MNLIDIVEIIIHMHGMCKYLHLSLALSGDRIFHWFHLLGPLQPLLVPMSFVLISTPA